MAWFKKNKQPKAAISGEDRTVIPEGLWVKCDSCKEIIYRKEVLARANVCPKCNYHFRISARERLTTLFDNGIYEELDMGIIATDPLRFIDTKPYKDRLKQYQEKTGMDDAVINAAGRMGDSPVVISAMEYSFMGGSMGSVVGEKITRNAERALERRHPLIIISASGGARMQEGALSLMQMAKISSTLARLDDAGIPYISILTDPTTGGVTASYAMLGDLNIAEPRALIGFAGPRVIEQTIRQKLPEGFQRSEFLLEHGMVDLIVERKKMREKLITCLRLLMDPVPADPALPAGS
ncbi:MAG: acetyl-CoA carboxylase carboxyltransferase subunit beta [Acidobacteria bacterium]|nr:MAG: acetyl-CoA carboxylase carboxyltransferase subunit beta [Acidobacteriota bacterium]